MLHWPQKWKKIIKIYTNLAYTFSHVYEWDLEKFLSLTEMLEVNEPSMLKLNGTRGLIPTTSIIESRKQI